MTTSTTNWSLDHGRIVLGNRVRSGAGDEIREGSLATEPTSKLLVTLTGRHSESYLAIRQTLELAVEGVAPLEFVGPADGTPYTDALVERIIGANVTPPIDVRTLTRLGAELATIVARVHSSGAWLGGIRPELVFVSGEKVLIAPRGPRFIATTPLARGMRSYSVPYLSPEELMTSRGGLASDVFSLCATLYFLGTGRHPFGDSAQISAIAAKLAMGAAPDTWADSGKLGELLATGMQSSASERPTAARLAEQLSLLA